jgi:carbon storage regulator
MLILSRRVGEEIVIAGDVRVRVTKVHGKRVRLAVEAPDDVLIHRGEVHHRLVGLLGEEDGLKSAETPRDQCDLELGWC